MYGMEGMDEWAWGTHVGLGGMLEGTGTVAIFATGNMGRVAGRVIVLQLCFRCMLLLLGVIHRQLELLAAIQARNHVIFSSGYRS